MAASMNHPVRVLWGALCLLLMSSVPAAAEFERLPGALKAAIEEQGLSPRSVGLWVERAGDDQVLAQLNADRLFNPASTLKLATSLAALDQLGPDYTWKTELWAVGELRDGVLDGDLVVRGTGDPGMVNEEHWRMLGQLRQAGVERIAGDVILDASHFDAGPQDPAAFNGQPLRAYNQGVYALHVNSNAQRIRVRPGRNGETVRVSLDPPLPDVEIDNRLRPGRGRCGDFQRGIEIDADRANGRLTLTGEYPVHCGEYELLRSVTEPERNHAGLFRLHWSQWGGELDGEIRPGRMTPLQQEPLVTHRSRPLADLIRVSNKWSSNVMTRHLMLTLGAERHGAPATMDHSRQALMEALRELGVNPGGMRVDNGSGLSRDARMSPYQLGQILRAGWEHPLRPEFQSSLALAGIDGTLRNRFNNGAERGHMHLKTGHLREVSAVAGYVRTKSGDDVRVVLLVNDPRAHIGPGRSLQEAVLGWVRAL
ncbi:MULTISPECIES: D-alanyl-D-alanine carboxypeptidase/D-alanyl-D-alanine-endopeptidase [unclassified Thioalkalivibrio]|uniref:D-alanyl-D-alanine carboxypeptidase/D-alanyl-D-alanine endopeptidase n=1 Tax=unclassified Thioalkalivibrio TaxID=2621013 RepID=UPI000371C5DA|nr:MULTISPECIES: D-alanyl-D-alanine carboxypeptidase/D-alanyl-D-alanine-endopeptidase [unclassified Thioalkalivibrio]